MVVPLRRRRFTIDEYHRMGEVGILHEDDRVELIEGEIVEMAPIGSRHAAIAARIRKFFTIRLDDRAVLWSQEPVLLKALGSEPQPDVLILAPRADFYASALPEPQDVLLLIEVADSALAYDRRTKIPLYARAALTDVWLVDVDAGRISLYRTPGHRSYRDVLVPAPGESFTPLAFPDITVTLADLLG